MKEPAEESELTRDVFISHASADKPKYVRPLADALSAHSVTFWLDEGEMTWGDSVVARINDGLRRSRLALVCLSDNFVKRPWPESEMNAVFAMQNNKPIKRVLPLILNSRDKVLDRYPLLAGLVYREFKANADEIAKEIAGMTVDTHREGKGTDEIEVVATGGWARICRGSPISRGLLIIGGCNLTVSTDQAINFPAAHGLAGQGRLDFLFE